MAYNGHKNYNYWNVALWLANDEGLYNMARECVRNSKTKDAAARAIQENLESAGITKTPDDAPYTISAIRAGIVGLE